MTYAEGNGRRRENKRARQCVARLVCSNLVYPEPLADAANRWHALIARKRPRHDRVCPAVATPFFAVGGTTTVALFFEAPHIRTCASMRDCITLAVMACHEWPLLHQQRTAHSLRELGNFKSLDKISASFRCPQRAVSL